jgi:hypothetical protein
MCPMGAEGQGESHQGKQDPRSRHRLQEERRRRAGVARRGHHGASEGPGRPIELFRPACTPLPPDEGAPLRPRERRAKKEALAAQDCVVLVTDHDAFDFEAIAAHAPLLVDTRGRYPAARPNLVKA